MLLTRKTEKQSTGLHIWVSSLAQPGHMVTATCMISTLSSI